MGIVRRKVFLSEFVVDLATSTATESWKKESYGVLVGTGKNVYHIKGILGSQTAEKKYSTVEYFVYRVDRIKDNIKKPNKVIGDFHSHTDAHNTSDRWGLSEKDKEFLKEYPEYISMIICLEEVDRLHNYDRIIDRALIHPALAKDRENSNLWHKLRTFLRCYYYDKKSNLYLKADIVPKKDLAERLVA